VRSSSFDEGRAAELAQHRLGDHQATAFFAGLRRGELRGLRCEHVDVAVIHVRRGWDDYKGAIDPKSKKGARHVPIPDVLAKHLSAHMLRTGRRGCDLMFGSTPAQPFTPKVIRTRAGGAWAAAVVGAFLRGEAIDLEPIKLHEFRHTYVSLMHAAGYSLEEIGDYAGHSSAYTTDRYRHLLPGRHIEAAKRLDQLLSASGSWP
jgi:integrase